MHLGPLHMVAVLIYLLPPGLLVLLPVFNIVPLKRARLKKLGPLGHSLTDSVAYLIVWF